MQKTEQIHELDKETSKLGEAVVLFWQLKKSRQLISRTPIHQNLSINTVALLKITSWCEQRHLIHK